MKNISFICFMFLVFISGCSSEKIANGVKEKIVSDVKSAASKIFQITDIVFDPYTDQIEFDILPLSSGLTNIDTSKAKLVFSKTDDEDNDLFSSNPKLNIKQIPSTKSKYHYVADVKDVLAGHYWLRLENIPEQKGRVVKEYTLVKKPIIDLNLSSNKPINVQVGDDFTLALSVKNLSPFAGNNIQITTHCSGERLKSISPESIRKEESQYNTKLIVEEIKPKEELIINLNYYAESLNQQLICEAYFEDYELRKDKSYNAKPTSINGKVEAGNRKKEASTSEDLWTQVSEASWNYCRAKNKNSSEDLLKECVGVMVKKNRECLKIAKDKTLSEGKACAENIYGSLPPV